MSSEQRDKTEVVPFNPHISGSFATSTLMAACALRPTLGMVPELGMAGASYTAGGDGAVEGSAAMEPLKARQHAMLLSGKEVIDLSMVNPDLPPPRPVLDRLLENVTKTSTHRYAVSRGVRRLREAFAEKYSRAFGVQLDPESQICVCLGSKDAMYHALRAVTQKGDVVIMSAPTYPAHLSAVHLVGASPLLWNTPEDIEAAAESLDELLSTSGARLVILNFPCNPSGRVVSAQWLRRIVSVTRKHRAFAINDFVYGEMCFGGKNAPSILDVSDDLNGVLEVYSLSKAYNVPGWRVGALSGDARVVREVAHQKSIADYGLFLPLQYAAAVALGSKEDLVKGTVTQYERRMRVLSKGLASLGWTVIEPKAGASVWAQFPEGLCSTASAKHEGHTRASKSVCVAELLLDNCGVLCTPGIVFGSEFDSYVRFAAVVPEERLRDVIAAMGNLE